MKRLTILLMIIAVAACESPTDPVDVSGIRPATAEEIANAVDWYGGVVNCANRERRGGPELANHGSRVRWLVADTIAHDGEPVLGGIQRADTIWIRASSAYHPSAWTHEAFHHILWANTGGGDSEHSDARWPVCAN